jgi:hypothetical protein
MGSVLRTEATDETQGFMKVLVGADDRILGFTMIGSEAGEVMAAVQTAMLAGTCVRTGEMLGRSRYPDNRMVRRGPTSCPNPLPKPYAPRVRLVGRALCSIAL